MLKSIMLMAILILTIVIFRLILLPLFKKSIVYCLVTVIKIAKDMQATAFMKILLKLTLATILLPMIFLIV